MLMNTRGQGFVSKAENAEIVEYSTNRKANLAITERSAPKIPGGRKGNGLLRSVGGLFMVGGIFWGTYILSSGGDFSMLTRAPGPVHVIAAGVVISIIAKYI